MKSWFNYFKIWFLVCGIVVVVLVALLISSKVKNDENVVRINEVCTETERVFDYADVLTVEEENNLRVLIAEKELEAKCDIVLLIMNESLEEYAYQYDPSSYGEEWTRIKADNFYDEYGFGWNKHVESDDGDGVLLLDNWFRESDGRIHTWLSTSGKVMDRYSKSMIDRLLDNVYDYVESDPYQAYCAYVETVAEDMSDSSSNSGIPELPLWTVIVIPGIVAIVFIIINLSGKEGKKTTVATSYVEGGRPNFRVNEDHFIRKTVSTRHIPKSSSSSGGGGGHISAGGHSHGGGGHSR